MRKLKLFLSLLMLIAFSVGNIWGAVVSGTAYNIKGNTMPTDWTSSNTWSGTSTTSYFLLTESANYVQTDEFCQNGFTDIKIKARKYGGPSATQLVITVEWLEKGGNATVLGTISPSSTTLSDYTITKPASVTGNKEGSIKISCKDASGEKGSGIQVVTVRYTSGTCGSTEPTVSLVPTSLAFGNVKQYTEDGAGRRWVMLPLAITGENLTDNVVLTSNYAAVINIENKKLSAGVSSTYTLTPDGDGAIDTTVNVVAYTNAAANLTQKITVSSAKATPEFDAIDVPVTINITETYAVSVAANDAEMGTVAISGGVSGETSYQYTDGDETLTIVATPKAGYEFVNWTYDDNKVILADENAASTTALALEAATITANFQAQSCTNLAAPALDEANTQASYEYANLAWTAVANAETYAFTVTKHGESTPHVSTSTANTSSMILNLEANTRYDYTVMAKGDGTTYCDESNALLEGYFETTDYPAATLTLSENGKTRTLAGSHKLNDVVTLPTEAETGVVGKVLVGWSKDADRATAPEYAKGAEYTIASTTDKLYAVYATETPGEANQFVLNAKLDGYPTSYETANTFVDHTWGGILFKVQQLTTNSNDMQWRASGNGNGTGTIYNQTAMPKIQSIVIVFASNDNNKNHTVQVGTSANPNTVTLTASINGSTYTFDCSDGNYDYFVITNGSNAGYTSSVTINYNPQMNYSAYVTTGARQLANPTFGVAEGTYTEAQNVTLTAEEGATIYYTLDGTDPTAESTEYTAAIELNKYGTYTIKAIAAKGDGSKSNVVSATYTMKLPFASVSELLTYLEDNSLTTLNGVTVTGIISSIDSYSSQYYSISYWVSDDGQTNELEVYSGKGIDGANFSSVNDLTVGDKVVVTGDIKTHNDNFEFNYNNQLVSRIAAEVTSVVLSGTANTTEYWNGDTFDFDGLSVKAIYNTGYEKSVTSDATFAINLAGNKLVTGTTSVNVTATYSNVTSNAVALPVTVQTIANTKETAYTATEAVALIEAGNDLNTPVYVKGRINHNGIIELYEGQLNVWVLDPENNDDATNSIQFYHLKNINGVNFESTDDLTVGDILIGYGKLYKYVNANDKVVYEFNGCELIERTVAVVENVKITGTATKTAYEAGDSFDFAGLTATAFYQTGYSTSVTDRENVWSATAIAANTTKVTVTATFDGKSANEEVDITVNTHAVTFTAPENGTLVVKNAGEAITSGDEFAKGTVLTVEAAAASAYYVLDAIIVKDAEENDVTASVLNEGVLTVPTYAITVSATFSEVVFEESTTEWREITFTEAADKGTLDGHIFGVANSAFRLTTTDKADGGKIQVELASGYPFGTADDYVLYPGRLKTGGKSTSKNTMSLYIPADGKLRIAVRSANSDDNTRNLVLTQNGIELYHQVVKDADGVAVQVGMTNTIVFPYIYVDVKQGTLDITYPENSLNFYAFAFRAIGERDITINAPVGGTLTVKNGDEDVLSGDKLMEGKVLTISAEANEDYILTGITVNGVALEGSTYTIGIENVVIAATVVEKTTPAESAFGWSEASAKATLGKDDNIFPTLNNEQGLAVTYESSNTDAATINATSGAIELVAEGTTTISAIFAGNETYKAKTVTYVLTVVKGGGDAIDNTAAEVKAVKYIENGRIFIRRGEKTYTIDGRSVR